MPTSDSAGFVALAGIASNLPDWDGLPMLFDMARFEHGHRVWGHNVTSIALSSLIVATLQYRFHLIETVATRLKNYLPKEVLTLEYERASIDDYFTGLLDGPTLIQRCCNMYWSSTDDNSGLKFWTALADDACQHDGQGICIEYDFIHQEFDTALRSAILQSDRPLPKK
ncbi:MAG: hypothetical protein R3C56_15950 [Pirellulaceae bacterium]